jgi:hypothetical protein
MKWIQRGMNRLPLFFGAAFLACLVLPKAAAGAPPERPFVLGRGKACLTLDTNGALLRWEGRIAEKNKCAVIRRR